MRGGFESLAQQCFLTLFPAREISRGERETALYTRKRTPQADCFDALRARLRGAPDFYLLYTEGDTFSRFLNARLNEYTF